MRSWALLAVVVAAFAAGAVAYGRSEGERAVDVQRRGLLAVRTAVGGRLLHPNQAEYDPASSLQCLVYRSAGNRYGLELCFDAAGGLIESVDRRGKERISSLRWDRAGTPLHIPAAEVAQAVQNVDPGSRLVGLLP